MSFCECISTLDCKFIGTFVYSRYVSWRCWILTTSRLIFSNGFPNFDADDDDDDNGDGSWYVVMVDGGDDDDEIMFIEELFNFCLFFVAEW